MKLEFYETVTAVKSDRWRWRIVAANGKIVAASSEGFARRIGAQINATLTYNMLAQLLPGSNVKTVRWWEFWK
jgi:uncharacterized protein YegP (UPF0339 family)